MMNKIIKVISAIIVVITLVYALYLTCCIQWFSKLKYTETINPIEVFNIITTLLLGLFVTWFIGKKLASNRFGIEFVIKDVVLIEESLIQLQNEVSAPSTISVNRVYNTVNEIHNCHKRLVKSLTLMSVKVDCTKDLAKDIRHLYMVSTDLNSTANDYGIPEENILDIQNTCNRLVLKTREVAHEVNDL